MTAYDFARRPKNVRRNGQRAAVPCFAMAVVLSPCLSPRFRGLVTSLLIVFSGCREHPPQADGFTVEVKHRQDIHQLEVTVRNRNKLLHDIVDLLRSTLDL